MREKENLRKIEVFIPAKKDRFGRRLLETLGKCKL